MKKFTTREKEAAYEVFKSMSLEEIGALSSSEIVDKILDAIDRAEGYPGPPEDKYVDAKEKVCKKIVELNGAVKDAIKLGLSVGIINPNFMQVVAVAPSLPGLLPMAPPAPQNQQINPEFKIGRVTKEF